MPRRMQDIAHRTGTLLAWTERRSDDTIFAAFIGDGALAAAKPARLPAGRIVASLQAARQWVEREAAQLGLPVRWLDQPPR